jgi:hypothetical protein
VSGPRINVRQGVNYRAEHQPLLCGEASDGRGFVIKYCVSIPPLDLPPLRGLRLKRFTERRVVVTAAHCLPKLPLAHAASYLWDRTYGNLLGRLNDPEGSVWAECLFADPVADIAVLGNPDGQELGDEADAYYGLIDNVPALRIGEAQSGPGRVLSLDGRWICTGIELLSGIEGSSLWIDPNEAGMSSSPILDDAWRAVGLAAVGCETVSAGVRKNERAGPQPMLSRNLPGWLLRHATSRGKRSRGRLS